jgi:hypothetical protein
MVGNKNQFRLTIDERCVDGGKTENVANRRKTAETEGAKRFRRKKTKKRRVARRVETARRLIKRRR